MSEHEVPAPKHAAESERQERRPGASDRRVQIAAARLRVVLDERLKRESLNADDVLLEYLVSLSRDD